MQKCKEQASEKVAENLVKAQKKCNIVIKAGADLDIQALTEAKERLAHYTDQSVGLYKKTRKESKAAERKTLKVAQAE